MFFVVKSSEVPNYLARFRDRLAYDNVLKIVSACQNVGRRMTNGSIFVFHLSLVYIMVKLHVQYFFSARATDLKVKRQGIYLAAV